MREKYNYNFLKYMEYLLIERDTTLLAFYKRLSRSISYKIIIFHYQFTIMKSNINVNVIILYMSYIYTDKYIFILFIHIKY